MIAIQILSVCLYNHVFNKWLQKNFVIPLAVGPRYIYNLSS